VSKMGHLTLGGADIHRLHSTKHDQYFSMMNTYGGICMSLKRSSLPRSLRLPSQGSLRCVFLRQKTFVILLILLLALYSILSIALATLLTQPSASALISTPADFGLRYQRVSFFSREDHLQLQGWFIPGVLADGHLTTQHAIIVVHGLHVNRSYSPSMDASVALAQHGFAVLAFDLRGNGESAPARLSLGYYEQRDVLGAVDFLRSGTLPYADLGRPRSIEAWGDSLGGATLLLAAAQEPSIQAVVTDSAFADASPLIREKSGIPDILLPGCLLAAKLLYGIDYDQVRPVDVVAKIAPRPLLLIHGTADGMVPFENMLQLAAAARKGRDAHVQTWILPGMAHVNGIVQDRSEYIQRIVTFFQKALN
jgi:fermentation-respiration switch protein FrsA (DUF1100 family)